MIQVCTCSIPDECLLVFCFRKETWFCKKNYVRPSGIYTRNHLPFPSFFFPQDWSMHNPCPPPPLILRNFYFWRSYRLECTKKVKNGQNPQNGCFLVYLGHNFSYNGIYFWVMNIDMDFLYSRKWKSPPNKNSQFFFNLEFFFQKLSPKFWYWIPGSAEYFSE